MVEKELIGWIAAVILFLVIIFSQPKLAGGQGYRVCSGNGYRNETDSICICYSPFYGADCAFRYCPVGKSWFSNPVADHVRYSPLVECSNMGSCDPFTGLCSCRPGYEGRACERWACPTRFSAIVTVDESEVASQEKLTILDVPSIPPCSGHGVCRTLAEMGANFDGRNLVRPPIEYDNWDADRIQGCLCDSGWEGYDCSFRTCPWGFDPLTEESVKPNEFTLQCKATSGFFTIKAMGSYTPPIPYDADPGYLKYALETIAAVGSVRVRMEAGSDGVPTACGSSSTLSTSFWFTDHDGLLPPVLVTNVSAATRQWPGGSDSLALSSGTATLRMATIHKLTCPICANCRGYVRFFYKNSVSDILDITSSGIKATIATTIAALDDLVNENWPDFSVSVTGTYDRICETAASSTLTITLYSTMGNIPTLQFFDDSLYTSSSYTQSANLTWTHTGGNGTLFECSNQGACDRSIGVCQCLASVEYEQEIFRAISSDGKGNVGNRGDCGHIVTNTAAGGGCKASVMEACSGHGLCNNNTGHCECKNGWYGLTCGFSSCPKGPAWVDEPISSEEAHLEAECSNMGMCDRHLGRCVCRLGFTGPACQYRDCPRDIDGNPCNGHGYCYSMHEFYNLHGFTYGSKYQSRQYPAAWDAHMIRECLCSSNLMANYTYPSNPLKPAVGTSWLVSGQPGGSPPLPGYTGWECLEQACPTGDNVDPRHNYGGDTEVQAVSCGYTNSTSNTTVMFTLSLGSYESEPIYGYYDQDQIKTALEYHPSIGNVTVWFPMAWADLITTACAKSVNESSGFYVRFDTEQGDLPLMTVNSYLNQASLTVTEVIKGTTINKECSGPWAGVCNRRTGKCMCSAGYGSSNGTNYPGKRGDCGYHSPNVEVFEANQRRLERTVSLTGYT